MIGLARIFCCQVSILFAEDKFGDSVLLHLNLRANRCIDTFITFIGRSISRREYRDLIVRLLIPHEGHWATFIFE